ncbi:DUF2628 domain-containing protein [Cohnella sp. LGH]|nr:DUF2628 domain-containing protein [Cohnella sp. LGH]
MPEHARFCSRCGGKVDVGTAEPQANPPVEKPTVSLEKPMARRLPEHQGNPSEQQANPPEERSPEPRATQLKGGSADQTIDRPANHSTERIADRLEERPSFAAPPDYPADDFDEQVTAFVQRNSGYYLRKWSKSATPAKDIGWNWAAFFLSYFWLAYRKQYGVVLLLLGVWIAIDIVNIAFDLEVNNVGYGLFCSVGIALGANALYYKHTNKQIDKINRYPLERSLKLKALSQKGGTSFISVFMAIGLLTVYIIINLFVLFPNFGKTDIQFGRSESGSAITGQTSVFEENESIHYGFGFPGKAGDIEVILEIRQGSDSKVVDRWELEVPSDWPGVIHRFDAPKPADYTLKIVMDDRVISKGKFSVKGRLA